MLALSNVPFYLMIVGLLISSGTVCSGEASSIEIFTATNIPVTGGEYERTRAALTIYAVDGLDRFESTLSDGLPIDPENAKVQALDRIQEIDNAHMAPAKNAAVGLARAIQYGVDRYPAVVFDERAVVYGVTDLVEALDLYEAWQREQKR
jgi:integrating conjugative element protein (TIGR03757 family)